MRRLRLTRVVPTTRHLLNIPMARNSNSVLDVHVDTITSDFGTYDVPNLLPVPMFMAQFAVSHPFAIPQRIRQIRAAFFTRTDRHK